MNAAAWQPTRTAPLQRLVVVAAAVTLGRGDVAILGFVVLAIVALVAFGIMAAASS